MRGRIILGLIVTLIGIVLVGDRLGYWHFGHLVGTYWPLVLIFIGLLQLLTRSGLLGPLILVAIGTFFQAAMLGWLPDDWGMLVWPVAILLVGLWLLLGGLGWRPKRNTGKADGTKDDRSEGAIGSERTERVAAERLDRFTLFGGLHTAVTSDRFRGGSVTAVFGGADIDLRMAKLVPGAKLDVVAMFGGVNLIVPEAWHVDLRGTPLFGGVENKVPPRDDPGAPTLVVTATAIFGGVTIRPPGPKDP